MDLGRVKGDMIKVISKTLSSVAPEEILSKVPYVEYDAYFLTGGEFYTEVYRLPTLNAKGQVRFALQLDDGTPVILTGESDYGVGNLAWEEGVFTQIIKHHLTVTVPSAGQHTVRIYMIDPELCFDKIVIYTGGYKPGYFGPAESYNTTYNTKPDNSYEAAYETKFLPVLPALLTDEFGTGYFVEERQIRIEAASAIEQSEFAYTENDDLYGGFVIAKSPGRYAMRTAKRDVSYVGKPAPALNYKIYVGKNTPYTLNVEVLAPTPSCDSFFFAVDGKNVITKNDMFDYNKDETFSWFSSGSVTPTTGVHTVSVKAKEDGLIISKLVLAAGSYSASSSEITQTVRTPHIGESYQEDVAVRQEIKKLLESALHLDSVPLGNEVGCYSAEVYGTLVASKNRLTELLNSEELLDEKALSEEKARFEKAYESLIASQKMKEGEREYLVYDDFEKNNPGNRPFGVAVFEEIGEPDGNVYREGDRSFLSLRAFKLQSKTQALHMGYVFTEAIGSGKVIPETNVRYNEAKWADIFRVKNEAGKDAVVVAIERLNATRSALIAYNGSTKKILATYEPGSWIEIRLEIDVERESFNLYIDGERVNETTLRFRNKSESLTGFAFGVKNENADLNLDYVKAYQRMNK